VVLEKDREDNLDRSCENDKYYTEVRNKGASWIVQSVIRNCLLKHVIQGKTDGKRRN